MSSKKTIPFTFAIVAIILGCTIFKQFDFETFKFEKPALAVVYIVTFVISVYFVIKGLTGKK